MEPWMKFPPARWAFQFFVGYTGESPETWERHRTDPYRPMVVAGMWTAYLLKRALKRHG